MVWQPLETWQIWRLQEPENEPEPDNLRARVQGCKIMAGMSEKQNSWVLGSFYWWLYGINLTVLSVSFQMTFHLRTDLNLLFEPWDISTTKGT